MKLTDLQINPVDKIIKWEGQEVTVRGYAPIAQKISSAELIRSLSFDDDGRLIPYKLDILLDLEMMYLYTNIEFPEDSTAMERYDYITQTGMRAILMNEIPKLEQNEFKEMVSQLITAQDKYNNNALAAVRAFVNNKITEEDIKNVDDALDRISGIKDMFQSQEDSTVASE
jgi:hypothetical protein